MSKGTTSYRIKNEQELYYLTPTRRRMKKEYTKRSLSDSDTTLYYCSILQVR